MVKEVFFRAKNLFERDPKRPSCHGSTIKVAKWRPRRVNIRHVKTNEAWIRERGKR